MPIRIGCRDKSLTSQQMLECKGVSTASARTPEARCADKRPRLSILCKSVPLLLAR